MRCLPMVLVIASVAVTVAMAPAATASPECVNTGPMTTLCQTPGHAQIVTSPPAMNNSLWNGWPYGGGFAIGYPW